MIKNDYENIECCRLCKSQSIKTIIDFGLSPLANSYPASKDEIENEYPLTVVKCDNCGHVQLKETINPKILFSNYAYSSSDSPSLINHFAEYAKTVVSKIKVNDYSSILEIGSNDGILLRQFSKLGIINLYGVEPASNIAEKSISSGAKIINAFFNQQTAEEIKIKNGKFDVICANNVFAHVAEIDSLINGVIEILTDDGVFIFENAYLLDTIQGLYFDQVYHEHLQYYGIKPLVNYLKKYGLEIFHIQHVSTQGGSFRIFSKRIKNKNINIDSTVENFIKQEENYKLYNDETYLEFNKKINHLSETAQKFIDQEISKNKKFCCYGCPAKFALFSKIFKLDKNKIQFVVDDSPLKQSKYSPGLKIPIVNKKTFVDENTDYCIISVWNMADSIIKNNPNYSGKFIIPLPEFKII